MSKCDATCTQEPIFHDVVGHFISSPSWSIGPFLDLLKSTDPEASR